MPITRESDLYAPIKAYLEDRGFTIRSEVGDCDVVGVSPEECVIAVELKRAFGLPVLYQALKRQPAVDHVYVGVPVPDGRSARRNWDAQRRDAVRLCRMLGVGLVAVRDGLVVLETDPKPYSPRKNGKSRAMMLGEFRGRSGDHNVGGVTRRPIVTAYREDALRCADLLDREGSLTVAEIRERTGVQRAGPLLLRDVYGWFQKVERGRYAVSVEGAAALGAYADVVACQRGLQAEDPSP